MSEIASVIPFSTATRMSEAEYDAERARLTALYGETSVEAAAKRDQALARLFERSKWTQEQLAAKENKSRQWIVTRLRFGAFLNFATVVAKAESVPNNLTEGRFRSYWSRTDNDGDDRDRFHAVIRMMQSERVTAPRRPKIGNKIREQFADGKWHNLDVIANKLDADVDHVRETLDGISKNQTYDCRAEKKKVGTGSAYRVFKLDKAISLDEITEKLTPILLGLEAEGKKTMATMAPAAVAILAHKLRTLLKEWSE